MHREASHPRCPLSETPSPSRRSLLPQRARSDGPSLRSTATFRPALGGSMRHFLNDQAHPLAGKPARVALDPLPQEEPEEVLITEDRERLTPSQMVDQKLLALMRTGNPGLYLQATGKPEEIRRLPQGP